MTPPSGWDLCDAAPAFVQEYLTIKTCSGALVLEQQVPGCIPRYAALDANPLESHVWTLRHLLRDASGNATVTYTRFQVRRISAEGTCNNPFEVILLDPGEACHTWGS